MSLTDQSSSSTSSSSKIQIISDALVDYAKITGIDLPKNSFAAVIERVNSPGDILELLQEREKGFKDYREGNQRLISCLSPTIQVIQAFSGILGEANGLVPIPPAKALFIGIDVLLSVSSRVTSGYDALLDLFECLGNFLKRLEVYTTIPPTPMMMDLIIKIMVELLSVLALATKQIKQGHFKKFVKKLLGRDKKIQAALERLNRLTKDEGLSAVAQTLGVVHGIGSDIEEAYEPHHPIFSTPETAFIPYNFETLLNAALTEYTERTGISLRDHPLASTISSCDNPESIFEIFHEQCQALDRFRKGDTRLFESLKPVLKVLNETSTVTGVASTGSVFPPTNAVFLSILILLSKAMHDGESYDVLVDIFEYIENVLGRLRIQTYVKLLFTPTKPEVETVIKIELKLLSVLALATRHINEGRFKRYAKPFLGEKDIESVLRRLDRLTLEETRTTITQTLDIIYGLVNIMQVVMEDGKASINDIRPSLALMQDLVLQVNKSKRDHQHIYFLHWLSPPDPWINHRMARREHCLGTATWFTQSDDFSNWKSEGSLLWIHGLPGCGKSVLCSSIIEDIRAICQIGLAKLVCFYFDFRDSYKQGARSLLCSLLTQLCHDSDRFAEILSSLYSVHGDGSQQPSLDALRICLKNILELPEQSEIYIVLDALDECPNISGFPTPREQVLAILEEIINLRLPHVHFCITSRLEVDIQYVLEALTVHEVALHEQAGQNQDIIDYIENVVSSDLLMRQWREEDRRLVVKTLTERGGGMFRWICCQYETLRQFFPGNIQRRLDELPVTLDETYERTLRGIDKQKQDFAHRIFQCLVVCQRPLRLEELAELFTIGRDAETIPTFNPHLRPMNPEEAVLSACSTMVTVVNVDGTKLVQFSHFSVKEYLTSGRIASSRDPSLSRFWVHPPPAHTLLARACLGVLLHLDDRIGRDDVQQFPLALYAARYWVDHARFENVSSDIHDAVELLFDRNKSHFVAWLRLYDVDSPFAFFTAPVHVARPYPVLYYAALCGLRDFAGYLIDAHPRDLNTQSGTRGTPLHAALDGGHQNVALLLLERGADIGCLDSQSRTPLHIACRGCIDVVSVLIDRGVDLNAEDDSRETPLHVASQWGHSNIVRLLLDHDADADRLDDGGWTPLHVASHEGHSDIVQLLLDHDANADRPDNGGWTPLHLASWEGHEHVVPLLLDHSINANYQDNGGCTPLHAASHEGHNLSVELLLNHGAEPNHTNSDGSTPLHIALQRNHHHVVQLLLDHGADLNYPNGDGLTLLQLASQSGHEKTVWFLLHNGAALDCLNGDGWSALHLASQSGFYDVVELLLEHGADANHAHSNGLTPLHLASQEGHDRIVRLLLDRGADANRRNSDGRNPLYLASQRRHDHIVRLLLEHGAVDQPNTMGSASQEDGVERKPLKGFAATRTRRRV